MSFYQSMMWMLITLEAGVALSVFGLHVYGIVLSGVLGGPIAFVLSLYGAVTWRTFFCGLILWAWAAIGHAKIGRPMMRLTENLRLRAIEKSRRL